MEVAFITATVLLAAFSVLAMFDGVYLHLMRYKLYAHAESRAEHISHTVRAALFPAILGTLYLGGSDTWFYIGLALVALDILVLGADAYMEKDSRAFMGGLPRWEYIVHLLVNGFHFAGIAVLLIIKLRLTANGVVLMHHFENVKAWGIFSCLATQLIPGGIALAAFHLLLLFPKPASWCNTLCARLKCC